MAHIVKVMVMCPTKFEFTSL